MIENDERGIMHLSVAAQNLEARKARANVRAAQLAETIRDAEDAADRAYIETAMRTLQGRAQRRSNRTGR